MVMSKDGAKPQQAYSQGNVQRIWLRARTGRSPNGNTAQGNALGVGSLTNWRAVSAKGKRKTLHWLLLRLQRANYFVHCYPGCYPGLYSYWAFSPSLLMCLFADTALSLKNGIFCCCKQRRRNQQRNKQKTRKCASDIKKPKNVDVLTKTTKRNALWFFSDFLSKVKCGNYVFRYIRQNGTFFREMAFAAMFFRFFCVFRCYKMRYHAAFSLVRKMLYSFNR